MCELCDDDSKYGHMGVDTVFQRNVVPVGAPSLLTQVGGDHYKRMKIQPVEYINANDLGFSEGNVIKYVSRWKFKGGIEDLRKAHHHLQILIELEEKKSGG